MKAHPCDFLGSLQTEQNLDICDDILYTNRVVINSLKYRHHISFKSDENNYASKDFYKFDVDTEKFYSASLSFDEYSQFIVKALEEKKKNINSQMWLYPAFFNLDDLRASPSLDLEVLEGLFDDLYIFDSFGVFFDTLSLYDLVKQDVNIKNYIVFFLPKVEFYNHVYRSFLSEYYLNYFLKDGKKLPSEYSRSKGTIIFLLDHSDHVSIKNGERVEYNFSHTKHLLQHMDAFEKAGFNVWARCQDAVNAFKILDAKSKVRILECNDFFDVLNNQADILVSIYAEDILVHGNNTINVWVQPAVHWIEAPEFFSLDYLTVIQSVAPMIDFVVTQNTRMVELTRALLFLGGCRLPYKNFLEIPAGIWERSTRDDFETKSLNTRYNFPNDSISIVNGGGAWDWTATDKFFEDFCQYVLDNPDTRIRFVQMGLRQETNSDHKETFDFIQNLISKYPFVFDNKYIFIEEWNAASQLLPNILDQFDFGFSVSKVSVEAFQAHRVRVTEYLSHSVIPIINEFDFMAQDIKHSSLIINNNLDFHSLFEKIEHLTKTDILVLKEQVSSSANLLDNKANSHILVEALDAYSTEEFELRRSSQANISTVVSKRIDSLASMGKLVSDLNNSVNVQQMSSVRVSLLRRIARAVLPLKVRIFILRYLRL